jgi:hypothetical protein
MRSLATMFGLIGLILAGQATRAEAGLTSLYSDTTNFSGFSYNSALGGGTVASVGGSNTSAMIADDITAGPGLGGNGVNSITFSAANLNNVSVTAGVTLLFYTDNGTGAAPGALFDSINLAPITIAAGTEELVTITSAIPFFTMPSGQFWAGISFNDEGGTTGATATQLGDLGMGIFAPPTVGSSNDSFYQSASGSSTGSANPAGSLQSFGGNPAADFGWDFSTSSSPAVIPEPSSLVLSGIAGAILAFAGARRKAVLARRPTAR